MSNELLKMADGFSMVADGIRALAALRNRETEEAGTAVQGQPDTAEKAEDVSKSGKAAKADKKTEQDSKKDENTVAVEDIRAVLAQKSQEGKSKEIKELLGKYGVAKLSAVKPEDYPALFQKAKVL